MSRIYVQYFPEIAGIQLMTNPVITVLVDYENKKPSVVTVYSVISEPKAFNIKDINWASYDSEVMVYLESEVAKFIEVELNNRGNLVCRKLNKAISLDVSFEDLNKIGGK